MDDAWIASIDIAQNKAWRSVALKMPTGNLAEATIPQAELYGLNTTNNGRLVVFGGGFPLVKGGKVVGAVGVSGSAVEHDVQVAKAAVEAFENQYKQVRKSSQIKGVPDNPEDYRERLFNHY